MARRARYSKLVTLDQTGHQSASVIGRRGLDGGLSPEPSGLVAVYLELITKENGKLAKSPPLPHPTPEIQTLEASDERKERGEHLERRSCGSKSRRCPGAGGGGDGGSE